MWPPNAFPAARVAPAYGFPPDQAWLDHVRLASVRLARGCSASFVSSRGLVQTNHHCAQRLYRELSTASGRFRRDRLHRQGARGRAQVSRRRVDQLIAMTDVHGPHRQGDRRQRRRGPRRRRRAARPRSSASARATTPRFAATSSRSIRRDLRPLSLSPLSRRAPRVRAGDGHRDFGGDLDNFEFPRYDLDVTFLRVYVDGSQSTPRRITSACGDATCRPGDLTLTSGHPGKTNRLDTVAELEFQRDVTLPRDTFLHGGIARPSEGILDQRSRTGAHRQRPPVWCRKLAEGPQRSIRGIGRPDDRAGARRLRTSPARQGRRRSEHRAQYRGPGTTSAQRSNISETCAIGMSSPKPAKASVPACSGPPRLWCAIRSRRQNRTNSG